MILEPDDDISGFLFQCSTGFSESSFHSLEIQRQLEEFMPLPYSIIVYSEPGIEKESLVHLRYRHSSYAAWPLACIDCEELSTLFPNFFRNSFLKWLLFTPIQRDRQKELNR